MLKQKPAILGGTPEFENFIPIVRPCLPSIEKIEPKVAEMLGSGILTKGHYLEEFELAVAEYTDARYAVGVSSCTMGLYLVCLVMGLKGKAILPSFTFLATASAAKLSGLDLVFADIDQATTNIDPASVEDLVDEHTSAVIAVHNFGNPANIEALERVAASANAKLIFDAAHALGSSRAGRQIGPQGDAQVFSLTPTKLVIAGEGGMVVTNNEALYHELKIAREYGMLPGYDSKYPSLNGRMSELHAAVGLESLKILPEAVAARNELAQLYRKELSALSGITIPSIPDENTSTYKDFCIIIDPDLFGLTRDQLSTALRSENIDSRNYYDPPVHLQSAYKRNNSKGTLQITEKMARQCISLPIRSTVERDMVTRICSAIGKCKESADEIVSFMKTQRLD